MMERLKRMMTPPLIVLASLLMWLEESLWVWLKHITAWIDLVPFVRRIEVALLRLPPYPMMIVFLLPMSLLFPLKVVAVYWATKGFWLASLALLATAKVLGTAVVARMYVVCQPKLKTIGWFCRLHDWLVATRDRLYAAVRAMPIYQRVRAQLTAIKQAARTFMARWTGRRGIWVRWRAIRRLHRHKNRTASEDTTAVER